MPFINTPPSAGHATSAPESHETHSEGVFFRNNQIKHKFATQVRASVRIQRKSERPAAVEWRNRACSNGKSAPVAR